MTKLWERDEFVSFEDCVFADDDTEEEVRDFIGPACTDNLLLWGQTGTGKSAIVKAVACSRFETGDLQNCGVEVLDCKDREKARRLNSKWLQGWYNMARFYSDCPVLILDELDELTEVQQRELTAFINWSNTGELRSMILATTNIDFHNTKKRNKSFSAALLSRFNSQLEILPLPPHRFVPVAQSKLRRAGLFYDDKVMLDWLSKQLPHGATNLDFRKVQSVVNRLIRRSAQANNNPPPKTKLHTV